MKEVSGDESNSKTTKYTIRTESSMLRRQTMRNSSDRGSNGMQIISEREEE